METATTDLSLEPAPPKTTIERFSRRKILFAIGFSILVAVAEVLGQIADQSDGEQTGFVPQQILFRWLAGLVIAFLLFTLLDLRASRAENDKSECSQRRRSQFVFPLVAFVSTFFAWLVLYLRYWPMVSMSDTYWILMNPLGSANHHPLVYNIWISVLVRTGNKVFGSEAAGVAFAGLVQMLIWCAAIAFLVWYLQRLGIGRLLIGMFIAYCALFPLIANYSFAIIKDSYFSLFVLLLIPVLLEIWRTRGQSLANWWFVAGTVFVIVGFAVTRNNGKIALPVILALLVYFASTRRKLALLIASMILVIALIPSMISQVVAGNQKFSESVAIPLQLVGAAVVSDSDENRATTCLSEENQQYFDQLVPLETWVEVYSSKTVDTTKFADKFDWEYLQESKVEFISNWAQVGLRCPTVYFDEYLVHTSQLWRLDPDPVGFGGQSYFSLPVNDESAGSDSSLDYEKRGLIQDSKLPQSLVQIIDEYVSLVNQNTFGEGVWLWLLLLSAAGFLYRRRGEWAPLFVPSLTIWGTLLVSIPVAGPFRYVQYATLVVPIGYMILLGMSRIERDQYCAKTTEQVDCEK